MYLDHMSRLNSALRVVLVWTTFFINKPSKRPVTCDQRPATSDQRPVTGDRRPAISRSLRRTRRAESSPDQPYQKFFPQCQFIRNNFITWIHQILNIFTVKTCQGVNCLLILIGTGMPTEFTGILLGNYKLEFLILLL